jgi:hypothetical protein
MRVLLGRARARDADRSLPQRLRAIWDLRRRPREGARSTLPEGRACRARWLNRDLGRRPADPLVLLRRRLRGRALPPHAVGYVRPLNLGTDRMVDELAMIVIDISEQHDLSLVDVEGPQGVRGRNSDNTRLRDVRVGTRNQPRGRADPNVPLDREPGPSNQPSPLVLISGTSERRVHSISRRRDRGHALSTRRSSARCATLPDVPAARS